MEENGPRIEPAGTSLDRTDGPLRKISLKDRDLAYLPEDTQEFRDYMRDLLWAQDFALANREEMMDRAMTVFSFTMFDEAGHEQAMTKQRINCHHNFTQMEHHFGKDMWITRKGAIQMTPGQLGVIPGSMATPAYVVRGKGNPLSLNSASHGAGRRMSRTQARQLYSFRAVQKDLEKKGVHILSAGSDEVPGVYKDIEAVMAEQQDLVETIARFDPRIVKMSGDGKAEG